MLKQDTNKIEIAGKIIEIEKRTGTKDGVDWISGTLKVETGEDNIIPIGFYSAALTKDKKPNKIYASLQTVCDSYKTVAAGEDADTVVIDSAQLSENIFFPTPETLIRGFQVQSSFFNRKAVAAGEEHAKFTLTGTVVSVVDEIKQDIPTGRVILKLLVVQYGDKGDVFDLVVDSPEAASYVRNTYSEMDKIKVQGNIVITEEVEVIEEPTAFGDPIEQVKRKTTRELIIKSATPPTPTDLTAEQVSELMKKRETLAATKKAESAAKQSAPKTQATTSGAGGFQL